MHFHLGLGKDYFVDLPLLEFQMEKEFQPYAPCPIEPSPVPTYRTKMTEFLSSR